MNHFRQLLYVWVLASLLTACASPSLQDKVPSASATPSQSSSEEKAVEQETPKEQTEEEAIQAYASVFDDYGKILSYAYSGQTPEDVEVYDQLLQSLSTNINTWVVEPTVRYPENLRYAFYDIDKDGQLEMLTGSAQSEGDYFVTGLYHIENGDVSLDAEGFVAGVGGARTAIQLYTNNSFLTFYWSSGTGEATGVLYELAGEDLIEVMQEDFQLPAESIEANFGKESSDILDVNTLDWKNFPYSATGTVVRSKSTSETETVDVATLVSGDLSILEGTWKSVSGVKRFRIEGYKMTFLSNDEEFPYTIINLHEAGGRAEWTLEEIKASPPQYVLYAPGEPLVTPVKTYVSDETKMRIAPMPQYHAPQEEMEDFIYIKEE